MTAGIYAITCTVNGHQYVGQSDGIEHRWHRHRSDLRLKRHHSRYLQRAWDRYGESAFSFSVLEVVDPPTEEALNEREIFYFTLLKPVYVGRPAGAQRGYKHSLESRQRMSAAKRGRVPTIALAAAIKATSGKPRPQSVRDKISATKRAAGIKRPDLAERNRMTALRRRTYTQPPLLED